MKRFKQFLAEEFRGVENNGIWLNPIDEEIEDIPSNVRAIASKNGDLIIINDKKFLHHQVISFAEHLYRDRGIKFPSAIKRFEYFENKVSLIRDGKTKAFYIGDDEFHNVEEVYKYHRKASKDVTARKIFMDELNLKRKNILKKTKKKNRYWTFFNKSSGN